MSKKMTLNPDEVRALLKEVCDKRGKKRWASDAGVTVNHIDNVLRGRYNPGWAILRALGLNKSEMSYERALSCFVIIICGSILSGCAEPTKIAIDQPQKPVLCVDKSPSGLVHISPCSFLGENDNENKSNSARR